MLLKLVLRAARLFIVLLPLSSADPVRHFSIAFQSTFSINSRVAKRKKVVKTQKVFIENLSEFGHIDSYSLLTVVHSGCFCLGQPWVVVHNKSQRDRAAGNMKLFACGAPLCSLVCLCKRDSAMLSIIWSACCCCTCGNGIKESHGKGVKWSLGGGNRPSL